MNKDFNKWAESYCTGLAVNTFKTIDKESNGLGNDAVMFMSTMFLARFVGGLIYRALNEKKSLNLVGETQEDFTLRNINNLKNQVQEAVASGFQNAMSAFSGQPLEYYCQIKPVPDMISEKVN